MTAGAEPTEGYRTSVVFLAWLAAAVAVVGLALVASGLAAPAQELALLGVFALLWATVLAVSAAAADARGRPWTAAQLAALAPLRPWLGLVCAGATLWVAPPSPSASAVDAPSWLHLAAPALLGGMGALLARHFARQGRALPEAPGLSRWARLAAWMAVLGSSCVVARHADFLAPWAPAGWWTLAMVNLAISLDAARGDLRAWLAATASPLPLVELRSVHALAHGQNPVSSILDALESFLGVDLRGSWAIRVVRRGAEPLAITALFVGWLGTSLTQVMLYEQGSLFRLGTVVGAPLAPGLHAHLPWPIDEVRRVPTARVMSVAIGNAEEEDPDREDVLWARRHEAVEYTFLLGNGRDLVTIDARLKYRIDDLSAWLTVSSRPEEVLRAIVHAAVTRRTVDRSLDQVLSENMAAFTTDVAAAVQEDADGLGLGVVVIGVTIGGMHPPVDVASEYEAVVSAQVQRDTLVLEALAAQAAGLPAAEADALDATSSAQVEAVTTLASARGDAAAFLGIRTSFEAEPDLYQFRRRLEALEANLAGQRAVIVDDRLERDGASLWLLE